jgi:glucose-6-phosphate 1-dehydrogenase
MAGLGEQRGMDPCAVVIFGASGDLTRRKLIPALWSLWEGRLLPEPLVIIGVARSPMTHEAFRERMRDAVMTFARTRPPTAHVWNRFAETLYYSPGDLNDPGCYRALESLLAQIEGHTKIGGNRLFYCATSPSHYPEVVRHLGDSGLAQDTYGWRRIIIEKPFGRDRAGARALNRTVQEVFKEEQVYRIDHYLGKETVQNILVFRFANGIFEPIWNREHVDHVQITVGESIGVEGRGAYYEEAGALRDMIQNHILQLLCLVAMEPPVTFHPDHVRDEKTKVLRAIRPIEPDHVDQVAVRGQYSPGTIEGEHVSGYLAEKGVAPNSTAETYAALRLQVDNWRWAGTPFYLRTGKRLPKRASEIAIQFKRTPHLLFRAAPADQVEPNLLTLRIQPDEGIALTFGAKLPGPEITIRSVTMDFRYGAAFGAEPPEAYERLLLDAIQGDATLYARGDWVDVAWQLLTPVLDWWGSWKAGTIPLYEAGSWGPPEADLFINADGRTWRRL